MRKTTNSVVAQKNTSAHGRKVADGAVGIGVMCWSATFGLVLISRSKSLAHIQFSVLVIFWDYTEQSGASVRISNELEGQPLSTSTVRHHESQRSRTP